MTARYNPNFNRKSRPNNNHNGRAQHGAPSAPLSSAQPEAAAEKDSFPIMTAKEGSQIESKATFAELGLAPMLLETVSSEGYTIPTPIQAGAIPAGIAGRDILGTAQTGTGKTAAFALPILHRLQGAPADKAGRGPVFPRALILSPTRELASQIAESFATYGKQTVLRYTTVFGGVSQYHQVRALRNGVDILIATPGRLMDLMNQRLVNLSQVHIFVLDEADRMLDMGFIDPIRTIAAALPPRETVKRQTMLFSATMPKEIIHLAESLLRDPLRVAVTPPNSTVDRIEQSVYTVQKERKAYLLEHLLEEANVRRAVVFTRTKFGAEKLGRKLNQAGITAESIHGDKNQNQRKRALDSFKQGRARVLVATDVAARGLDVDGITHVFNIDLPLEPEAYVHRIGRTGRAGAKGIAISFCDPSEYGLLRAIERLTKFRIPAVTKLPDLKARMTADQHRVNPPQMQRTEPVQHAAMPGPMHHERPHGHAAPYQGGGHRPQPRQDQPQRTRRDSVPSTLGDHKQGGAQSGQQQAPRAPRPEEQRPQGGGNGGAKPFAGPRPNPKSGWAWNGRGGKSRAPGKGVRRREA